MVQGAAREVENPMKFFQLGGGWRLRIGYMEVWRNSLHGEGVLGTERVCNMVHDCVNIALGVRVPEGGDLFCVDCGGAASGGFRRACFFASCLGFTLEVNPEFQMALRDLHQESGVST